MRKIATLAVALPLLATTAALAASPKPFAPIVIDQAKLNEMAQWADRELRGPEKVMLFEWLNTQEQLAQSAAQVAAPPAPPAPAAPPAARPSQSHMPTMGGPAKK
jgi:hypothetical protein